MNDFRKGAGLGLIEQVPAGMDAFEIDPARIGRAGYLMIGQHEALERWIETLRRAYVKTPDKTEKRIIEDILVGMCDDMERVRTELAAIAATRNAIKAVDEFDVH